MSYTTLISTAELAAQLENPQWVVIDCRFRLDDAEAGRQAYLAAHIPGAQYAHLNEDLSGPIVPGQTGRHPLPAIETFAQTLSQWGIDEHTQVVAYDDAGGMMAGRLWWMLRWLGHDQVAVLDGDFRTWQNEGRPTRGGVESRVPRTFVPRPRPEMHASIDDVLARAGSGQANLFDARDESRYRGDPNPLDPVAGHIPGAKSAAFKHNLGPDGKFLSPDVLRARYKELLAGADPNECIFYCGSGVSVHHDLLALEVAGLSGARPFIGSWSEWINDPARPVATGDQP